MHPALSKFRTLLLAERELSLRPGTPKTVMEELNGAICAAVELWLDEGCPIEEGEPRWGTVSLMGHNQVIGLVSKVCTCGIPLLRVERPKVSVRFEGESIDIPGVIEIPERVDEYGSKAIFSIEYDCEEADYVRDAASVSGRWDLARIDDGGWVATLRKDLPVVTSRDTAMNEDEDEDEEEMSDSVPFDGPGWEG